MALTAHPKRRPTVHDKKRVGQHHKVTKRYSRAYWPYLPMLLVLVVGFFLNVTWSAGQGVLGYATSMSPDVLLQDTNEQRTQNGLSDLSENSLLMQAAQTKANDMVARDYWSHVTPDGRQPWSFITAAGYSYQTAGENLAYGFDNSDDVIAAWMNSADHRANILNTTYQDVGFGIANSPDYVGTGPETVVVAMYAEPYASAAPISTPQSNSQPTSSPQQSTPTVPVSNPTATTVSSQNAAKASTTPTSSKAQQQAQQPTEALTAKSVSRIGVLTNGNAQWASLALSAVATICIIAFVLKHGRLWRRYLLKGEEFAIEHPLFDTMLLVVAVIGFVLTRTSGFIQ